MLVGRASHEVESSAVGVVGEHRLAEVFALDRVLGAHQGEHRVRVLDHADAGAAVELLERVVVGVFGWRGGVGGRHDWAPRVSLTLVSGTKLLPSSGAGQRRPGGSVRAAG